MFRTAAIALAATLAVSSAATAQESFNWTGVYGGVSYSMGYEPTLTDEFLPDTRTASEALGFFGGYNHQFGQYVVGAELHATSISGSFVTFMGDDLSDIIEFRVRGGYAFDRVLVTGSVGYASQTYFALSGPESTVMDGITYGIGVDYALSNSIFVGAEYVARDLSGGPYFTLDDVGIEEETFRLRFGIRF